jgi:uncharacterized protein YndB with AHSA1/START domain
VTEIRAAGVVEAPPPAVFDHLADLRTHWALAGGRVMLLDATGADGARGGRVRMRGPFGLGRDAVTEVLRADPPRVLEGRASIGEHTAAEIRWTLEPRGEGATLVELSARVVEASGWDRAILAAGGHRWLTMLFDRVIDRLAALGPELSGEALEPAAEPYFAYSPSKSSA